MAKITKDDHKYIRARGFDGPRAGRLERENGMDANQKVIKTLIRYGVEQGIASARIDAAKLFLPIK